MNNMEIWNAVSKTDPSHTKRVNQRGGFTAIDAHYQIEMATRQFGPVGTGWGYITSPAIFENGFIIVPVTIWHGDRSNTFGPVLGCAEMFGNRPDADAPKKATTDAITKGLSQLGFNADVFLGKFDDNKYIEQRKREETEPTPAELRDRIKGAINRCVDAAKVDLLWENQNTKTAISKMPEPMQNELAKARTDKLANLSQGVAA